MDKLKISVLFWEERSPDEITHDEVVDQVSEALRGAGHEVSAIGLCDDLRELLDKLDEYRPDLVFNLCERFADNDNFEMNVTAVLEMLGQPFTGTGPQGMAARQDKVLTKKLLQFHGVPYPNYAVFDRHNIEFAGKMHFPLFVKPLRGDTSLGIGEASLVTEYPKLVERIDFIHNQLKEQALVEEYVEGREFYVGVLGNDPPEALPLMELDFSSLPPGTPRVFSRALKDDSDPDHQFINVQVATDLAPETRARIIAAGREAAFALKVRDYARVDIRLPATGTPVVVEVNANPYLERTSAFALAALQSGLGFASLIDRIVETAWRRNEPTPFLEGLQKARAERAQARRALSALIEKCDIKPA
ncbi:D-alanine--D-alanine ligase [Dehalogenimonas sp. 4OHTPN]|uniref:D-alanine--D-alanine ligase n=1 Tax=Dehalogenimonas sp. 4OHTPN TaxID=3166643 RepID=A0AAU8GA00_9CHLR